ncbi:MAG: MotA/TolQ/ExbB proton channel family protein [Candidatus Brocadia sinica]|nr:MotA/TolQ/ExbB proton channel family protein [Candidatus Brocadia sinica]NUO04301.1 MotA/TolQ/ExbB proton channel family protein [Candidatus Brocadia sinica]
MNLLTLLQTILSVLSSAMLYPVIVLLVVFFFLMMITMGGFVSEYWERKKQTRRQEPKEFVESLLEQEQNNEYILHGTFRETQEMPFYFREYFRELVNELKKNNCSREVRIEYLLQSMEQKMVKDLDNLRLLIRVGPTLGLMGTIIPMGPALSALSQGDLEKLSSNIIIAFTTTVVGLAIGIIAYFLSMIKNRWIHEDIKNLEYFTECIMEKGGIVYRSAPRD